MTAPITSAVDSLVLPAGYSFERTYLGKLAWKRGETMGEFSRDEVRTVVNDAHQHASRYPLVISHPKHSRQVQEVIYALITGATLTYAQASILRVSVMEPLYALRLACAMGNACGKGSAAGAVHALAKLGVSVERDGLVKVWMKAHEAIDPEGFWVDPIELRMQSRDCCEYLASEAWRRATIDAFDRVRRSPMTIDEQACAWAHVAIRYQALHLLGVTVDAIADIDAAVRAWLPESARKVAA